MEQISGQSFSDDKEIVKTIESPLQTLDETITDYYANYAYGSKTIQLRPGVEVEKSSSSGGQYYYEFVTKTSGTGIVSYAGMGFTPKLIKITGILASGDGSISHGTATSIANQSALWTFMNPVFTSTYSNGEILQVRNSSSSQRTYGVLSSIDIDGISINWTRGDMTIQFQLECYG